MSDFDIEIYDVSNDSVIKQFDQLQVSMKVFSQRLDTTLLDKRNDLITQKQRHGLQVHDLANEESRLLNEIATLQTQRSNTNSQLLLAKQQLTLQKLKVEDLLLKQNQLTAKKTSLNSEIEQLNESLETAKTQLNQSSNNLSQQVKRDLPELIKFESYLGLKIESSSIDLLKFIFVNIDPHDCDREFWIELNVAHDSYKVAKSLPVLSDDIVQLLEDEFNHHKELVKFLKTTRNLFKDLV